MSGTHFSIDAISRDWAEAPRFGGHWDLMRVIHDGRVSLKLMRSGVNPSDPFATQDIRSRISFAYESDTHLAAPEPKEKDPANGLKTALTGPIETQDHLGVIHKAYLLNDIAQEDMLVTCPSHPDTPIPLKEAVRLEVIALARDNGWSEILEPDMLTLSESGMQSVVLAFPESKPPHLASSSLIRPVVEDNPNNENAPRGPQLRTPAFEVVSSGEEVKAAIRRYAEEELNATGKVIEINNLDLIPNDKMRETGPFEDWIDEAIGHEHMSVFLRMTSGSLEELYNGLMSHCGVQMEAGFHTSCGFTYEPLLDMLRLIEGLSGRICHVAISRAQLKHSTQEPATAKIRIFNRALYDAMKRVSYGEFRKAYQALASKERS